MKKKLLVLLAFFLLSLHNQAQKVGFEFGVKAGGDYSIAHIKAIDTKNIFLGHAGVYINTQFPLLGFQAEGLFTFKNVNTDISNASAVYETTNLKYLQIPLLLEYTTLLGFLTIQTGPQFGLLLSSNTKDINAKDLYADNDFSWAFGLKGNIPVIGLHIYGRYILGIKDINQQTKTSPDQIQLGLEYRLFGNSIGGL